MPSYQELHDLIITGKRKPAAEMTQALLDDGKPAVEVLNEGLLPGMSVVGEKFQSGEYFISEMLLAARALNAGLAVLKPLLEASDIKPVAKVLLGTVKGDIHDIGKNLVGIMLKGNGFEVIDAGVDASPARLIELCRTHQPQVLGLSALLTTTMPAMADTIAAFEQQGLRSQLKVIVGGAPVTQAYAEKIGADGYAKNAPAAVDLVKGLLKLT
ncbi:MAG: corrinoid protein [Calditrichaeota bacterium]|nr:corrinoid protein [Calditrichota bacterium]